MIKNVSFKAFYIAEKIDLAACKSFIPGKILLSNSIELYSELTKNQFCYVLSYGAIVFSNTPTQEIESIIKKILQYSSSPASSKNEDDLTVKLVDDENYINLDFEGLQLSRFDIQVNKMIMLHLAQSVTLDHYNGLSQNILGEVKSYTQLMKDNGKVKLGHRKSMEFIGRILIIKNSMAENLYIIDSPESTWEDEYLDRLHKMLTTNLELSQRYREIDNTLKIIEDNIMVFMSYRRHQESSRLEWIIIILIVIEVIETFASKIL